MHRQEIPPEVLESIGSPATPATAEDLEVLRTQLGREARGVAAIAARCTCGNPLVVATEPRLPDGTPFPTTFYLTSAELTKACSVLEAEGAMEPLNGKLRDNEGYSRQYRLAHEDYLTRRSHLGSVPEVEGISAGGMPTRVKCLHAVVGHALAAGPGVNPVGDDALAEIESRGLWSSKVCHCQG